MPWYKCWVTTYKFNSGSLGPVIPISQFFPQCVCVFASGGGRGGGGVAVVAVSWALLTVCEVLRGTQSRRARRARNLGRASLWPGFRFWPCFWCRILGFGIQESGFLSCPVDCALWTGQGCVCRPNCLWWRQSSVNQSVTGVGNGNASEPDWLPSLSRRPVPVSFSLRLPLPVSVSVGFPGTVSIVYVRPARCPSGCQLTCLLRLPSRSCTVWGRGKVWAWRRGVAGSGPLPVSRGEIITLGNCSWMICWHKSIWLMSVNILICRFDVGNSNTASPRTHEGTHTQPDIGASSIVAVRTIALEIVILWPRGTDLTAFLKIILKLIFFCQVFL